MSELKTLKDITEVNPHSEFTDDNPVLDIGDYVEIEYIKAVAIEHIKSWKESLENPFTNDPEWKSWMQSRIDVFMEFFNLTEDDLK